MSTNIRVLQRNKPLPLDVKGIMVESLQFSKQIRSKKFVKGSPDFYGAEGESVVFAVLNTIIRRMGLENVFWVSRNEYTPKRYKQNRGKGLDLRISIIKNFTFYPLLDVEVKNMKQRYVSPYDFKHRILRSFKQSHKTKKLLIHYGSQTTEPLLFSQRVANKLFANKINYIHLPNIQTLTQFAINTITKITNKLHLTNSNNTNPNNNNNKTYNKICKHYTASNNSLFLQSTQPYRDPIPVENSCWSGFG